MPPQHVFAIYENFTLCCVFRLIFFFCVLTISRTGESRHQHRNLPGSPSGSLFCHLQSRLTQHFNFLHCRSAWAVGMLWNCSWANGKNCNAQRECRKQKQKLSANCFSYFPLICAIFTKQHQYRIGVQSIFGHFSLHLIFNIISFCFFIFLLTFIACFQFLCCCLLLVFLFNLVALTSGTRFRQQFLHNIIVCNILSHSRILDELLLDGNTNVMACQQLLQFLKCLQQQQQNKAMRMRNCSTSVRGREREGGRRMPPAMLRHILAG